MAVPTPTLMLDHLVVAAPTLEEGVAHVRDSLGLDMPYGGAHPEMGTHNHLLRLGDGVFLEVIAVDPSAPAPARPRWFGLDDAAAVRRDWDEGRRLRGWVARTGNLDPVLARHGDLLGGKTRVSRGDRSWRFAVRHDGAWPEGGAVPPVIDWGERGTPAPSMPDLGARLASFTLAHPDPQAVSRLYAELDILDPPVVLAGTQLRYSATIEVGGQPRTLR